MIQNNRQNIVLICPDNDSEAHMILTLAEKARISIIRSEQPHGAKLELEPDLNSRLSDLKKSEIWIVETPGVEKEKELTNNGYKVKIIDHHTYNDVLDRLIDPVTGLKKPSSLEQFINLAKITDDEIKLWGFDPKTIRGIGIMDARYVQGLREAGYSQEETDRVFDLQKEITAIISPDFAKDLIKAEEDWNNRTEWNGYIIIKSKHSGNMRSAISQISIYKNSDTIPMIISAGDGKKISVQNVTAEIVNKLKEKIKADDTYSFGSGRCWGADNKNHDKKVTIEQVLDVLK